ncbi:MAG: hypothetical protein Fur002_23540 [Anaerolineales bacterium]
MKLSRVLFGFLLGLTFSLLASANFLSRYAGIDLAFLILIPALAFAYLFAQVAPKLSALHVQGVRRARYAAAFLFSVILAYLALGFMDEVIATPLPAFLFTFALTAFLSALMYALEPPFVQFLNRPLHALLALFPPVFLVAAFFISADFPALLNWNALIPIPALGGIFLFAAILGGAAGFFSIANSLTLYPRAFFLYLQENLPGVYVGGAFFFVNLILASALNHPALGVNSVLFETDAGAWMTILASPQSDAINRAVHPLSLLIARPLIRSLAFFFGNHWALAALLVIAALSGLCVFMTYLFVKRAAQNEAYAVLFALFFGLVPANLLFGSLTENYIFGMSALIAFFLLIQKGETRLMRLVPLGVIVFGITVTNLAQTLIGLFFQRFSPRKIFQYALWVLTLSVALVTLTNALYPQRQTFFFIPADLAFERNFVKPTYTSPLDSVKEKAQVLARTMFLYQVVAPDPLLVISQKKNDPFPTLDVKTYDWREHQLASYKGWGNLPLAAWLLALACAAWLFARRANVSPHKPLMLGLLGVLAFNLLLHFFYGAELFLYVPYWTYALIFFLALAYAPLAGNVWFERTFPVFIFLLAVNNFWFLFVVFRALAPFFK